MTKYPKIFKGSYWGICYCEDEIYEDEIIKNRNEFVREFDIKSSINDFVTKLSINFFDHEEAYIARNNRHISIVSPYGEHNDIAEELGYKPYKHLYHPEAYTYIRVFENGRDWTKFFILQECIDAN